MARKSWKTLGLSLIVIFTVIGAFVFPAYAASQAWMSVIGLVPGSQIRLEMMNLPAFTEFTVTMGPAGGRGIGAPVVAHFKTQWGVNVIHWFEIQTEVAKEPYFDVRVDDGAGTAVFLTVDNTTSVSMPAATPTPAPTPTPKPWGWNITLREVGLIKIMHVQRDGIVQAVIRNMPANTEFTTTIGFAGTKGLGGYPVGTLTTGNASGQAMVGTFEIPSALRGALTLDIRVAAPGYVYYATFRNIDY
jgi:hypothetical protein